MDTVPPQEPNTPSPDSRTEAERFDDTLKHLLSVPKAVIDKREAEYQTQREEWRKSKKKQQPG